MADTTAAGDNSPVAFPRATANRVLAATRYVERNYRNPPPGPGRGARSASDVPGYVAKATSSVTARSGSTPGTGSATLHTFDGATLTADLTDIPVWNITNQTIANGSWMIVLWASAAWWVVAVDQCDHLG